MLIVISAFLTGVALVIIIEAFFIYHWFQALPQEEPKLLPVYTPVTNPEDIAQYCGIEDATESETCMFLNLIFQFLWKEWRDTPRTRDFFIKRMNLEFQEMLLNKTAGKLMEQITVRDYHLGDSLPVIKKATVMKIDTRNPTNVPREIDIALDIEYSGGFIISLDVDLIFGKSTHFTVKLNYLKGRMRLQFTRNPCTHWSFSFYEDPIMELAVESNFQGRNLPKLTSFIHNQIRRAIKKKHTFPRYKVRYKPFFIQEKPQDGKNEVYVHSSLITVGKLEVEIVECTRLIPLPRGSHIYCSLSLDSLPWKEDMPLRRSLWPVHEVLICRSVSGSIGVSFYREFEGVDEDKHEMILIKTVNPNSPATQVDIQRGDILLSVNNVDIISMKQAVRLVKNAGNKFTFKLQRPPSIIHDEHPGIAENEIFEEAVPENIKYDKEIQESFDYNSIVLQDEDSETEEFVNIIVHEIGEELINDDSTRKQFYEKVKKIERMNSSIDHTNILKSDDIDNISNISLPLQDDSIFTPKKRNSINFKNDPLRSSVELEKVESLENSPKLVNLQKTEDNSRLQTKHSFSFFRKNKLYNSSNKSNSSSTTDTTDTSDSTSLKEHPSVAELKKTFAPHLMKRKKVVEEKPITDRISNNDNYEPLGVHSKLDGGDNQNTYIEWDNISQNTVASNFISENIQEDEKESMGQKTTLVSANEDPVFNEIFAFDVEKEHKYMSICVWGKCEETFNKDFLLGYVSIPLMDLAVESLSTSSRKSIQTFALVVGSNRSAVNRTYLRTMMPGLNLSCCNGDITLAFKYSSSVPECDLESEEIKLYADELKRKNEVSENKDDKDYIDDVPKEHKFVGAEFYFPTLCDYCQNKVWRKVAFQCSICAMVSHKRCIQKAQTNTYCTIDGVRAKPPAWQTTDTVENTSDTADVVDSPLLLIPEELPTSSRLIPLTVPDENDLRPGIKHNCPSPNMLRRRKHAKKRNSFVNDTENAFSNSICEEVEDGDFTDSISTAAITAKEAGRELFASLDECSRKVNIQEKVKKLQTEIDIENEEENCLREKLSVTKDVEKMQKIQMLLRKSEERKQALALLMIQYCAALKECAAVDEPQQYDV